MFSLKTLSAVALTAIVLNAHAASDVDVSFSKVADIDVLTADVSQEMANFSVYNYPTNVDPNNFLGATCTGNCADFAFGSSHGGFHDSIGLATSKAGSYSAVYTLKYADADSSNETASVIVDTMATIQSVSAVPEPGITTLLLSGLGLMGFMTYRRRNN